MTTETGITSAALRYEAQLMRRISNAVTDIACKIAADRGDHVVVSKDMQWAMARVLRRCEEDREFRHSLMDDDTEV